MRDAAAEAYGVTPDYVLAGNGSSELIWLICLAFLGEGDTVDRVRVVQITAQNVIFEFKTKRFIKKLGK